MSQASVSEIPLPSNRTFGWTFAVVFALVGLFFHPWLLAASVAVVAVTLTRAHWLAPLNRAWMKLGAAMHMVVSPVIMGAMYFGVFTPMGWVMRRFGWDAMRRSRDATAKSYWIRRDPAGPADDSYRNLF
jgi:saxitoxin biosynthesis operon SxtJ-like protein